MNDHKVSRTLCLVWLLLCSLSVSFAAEPVIPLADDFAQIGERSDSISVPIVVFVSRDGCPYCRTLRDGILEPMLKAGKFEQRALLVEVNLDGPDSLLGFDGKPMSIQSFSNRFKAVITPTLLFLDKDGQTLSEARVGISNIDLYVYYLDKAIDESLAKLK